MFPCSSEVLQHADELESLATEYRLRVNCHPVPKTLDDLQNSPHPLGTYKQKMAELEVQLSGAIHHLTLEQKNERWHCSGSARNSGRRLIRARRNRRLRC